MSNCGKFRKAPWKIEDTMPESEAMRILRAATARDWLIAEPQLPASRAGVVLFGEELVVHFPAH
jgi:hypothetical protein